MNPLIVIPSYWAADPRNAEPGAPDAYDHATPLNKSLPELETCLDSLDRVRGVTRVCVLLVAPPAHEKQARQRVEKICAKHAGLSPVIVGRREAHAITSAIAEEVPRMDGETISLRGYGAIRNLGLVVAAVLNHDVVVFMDDDEVALDGDFLVNAVYGLGRKTRQDLTLSAKSGYFLDKDGNYTVSDEVAWYNKAWSKHAGFNSWIRSAMKSTRITRSNVACGGCMALHASAFSRVPFDPWISRGEDLDYLINLRLFGLDMWFDNKWNVLHVPPKTPHVPARFMQDAYRWVYESRKLECANARIGIHPVIPSSLDPYPGPWLSCDVLKRVRRTAYARAAGTPDKAEYLAIATSGVSDALAYAERHASSYLSFQNFWPTAITSVWDNKELAAKLLGQEAMDRQDAGPVPTQTQGDKRQDSQDAKRD